MSLRGEAEAASWDCRGHFIPSPRKTSGLLRGSQWQDFKDYPASDRRDILVPHHSAPRHLSPIT